jgi:chromosome segregation ATPase
VALTIGRGALDERVSAIEREARQATEEVARLSTELAELERRAAAGEQVSSRSRTEAEAKLAKARARHGEPWAERRAGVEAAIRDADRELRVFVREHLPELAAELSEDAEAAAEAVNRACRALSDAYLRRMEVERQVMALAGTAGISMNPGDVARTKAEAAVAAADALLRAGGEAAPVMVVRQPEPVEPPAESEPEPVTAA